MTMEQTVSHPATSHVVPHHASQAGMVATLKHWLGNARTRRQLAWLDDRLLADAGISRSERNAEVGKAFWQ